MQCAVPFCENIYKVTPSQATEITFHRFPSEESLRAAWLKALGRKEARLPDSAVVCSQHFLNEDFYETESGVREICPGAIPSSALVCMTCLDTDSELLRLSKHKLQEAYEQFTGDPCALGNLQQTVCVQCAQTLRDFSRFREQSLRARSLMMHLLQTHGLVTMKHLKLIKRDELKSEPVTSPPAADDSDSHTEHDADNQTAPEEDDNVQVKIERDTQDCPLVEKEIEIFAPEVPILDPLKYEDDEDSSVALPSRLAAYNLYKALATEEADANQRRERVCVTKEVDATQRRGRACANEEVDITQRRGRAHTTEKADTTQRRERARATDSGTLHNQPSASDERSTANIRNCDVIMQTRQADSSCDSLNDTACKDAQYRAASESEDHNDEKRFVCKLCEYRCRFKSHLVTHMLSHTGGKLFACDLCEYKSGEKASLVRHIKTHTGEKPFACNLCENKFRRKTHLINHLKTHTGEKPFACELCENKFGQKSNLDRHMKTHFGEKPFACQLCGSKFGRKSHLDRHMKTHSGEKPFACKLCNFKCGRKFSLIRHITLTHSVEIKPLLVNYTSVNEDENAV